jgi:alkylhydroperoxidase family enzyme
MGQPSPYDNIENHYASSNMKSPSSNQALQYTQQVVQDHYFQQQQQQQQQLASMRKLYASSTAATGYGGGSSEEQKLADVAAAAVEDVRSAAMEVSGDVKDLRRIVAQQQQVLEAMRHQLGLVGR